MANHLATGTILDRIMAQTAADVADRAARIPLAELERRAGMQPPALSMRAALRGDAVAIIAEIKRASPSRGTFPVAVEPAAVAADYLRGGAAAISVLTDQPFFQGSLADLTAVTDVAHGAAVPAPVLRKDFMLSPYQIVEARAYGADTVLLIVAALPDDHLATLHALAVEMGMDVLVEVHDEPEMDRAARLGASLIGINNRDLRTFTVDLATTERLAPLAPAGSLLVGESGIFTAEDMARVGAAGVSAVLVGESLILAADRSAAVAALRAAR